MVLRMNAMFRKVLKEVLMCLLIMEPNVKRRGTGRLEDKEDPERKGFRVGLDLCLGAMRSLSERERERNRTQSQKSTKKEKKGTYA